MADYTNILQKGQRIAYWWSDEDSWLKGTISKALTKVTTTSTIRWTVKVNFDNGDPTHTLTFHPLEKRWKVFHPNKKPPAEPKKPSTSKKSTKPAGEKKTKANKKVKSDTKVGEKEKKVKAKSATATSKSVQATLSFGPQLQSKIKEVSSKMHTAKTPSGLVNYSPNSILAVKAAHAKSPVASHPTASIGYSSSLPRGTLSPDLKKRKLTQHIEEKMARTAASQVSCIKPHYDSSLISPPSPGAKGTALSKTWDKLEVAKSKGSSLKSTGSGGAPVSMESLYKSECNKAEKFVDYMTAPSKQSPGATSPGWSDDGSLELKMDQE